MANFFNTGLSSPTTQQIARSFRWLGWVGFSLQLLLGFLPILVVVANVFFNPKQRQIGFSLGLWMAIACLIILLFSMYWCFRYTRLANRLELRDERPAKSQVIQDLKWGLAANLGAMILAVLIAFSRISNLTFKMLSLPQGSTIVTPNQMGTTLAPPGALITPSNMIAIQAMICAIAAGLVGTIVAILLLDQVGQHRNPNHTN
jgi:signal transduction histidine kinase